MIDGDEREKLAKVARRYDKSAADVLAIYLPYTWRGYVDSEAIGFTRERLREERALQECIDHEGV